MYFFQRQICFWSFGKRFLQSASSSLVVSPPPLRGFGCSVGIVCVLCYTIAKHFHRMLPKTSTSLEKGNRKNYWILPNNVDLIRVVQKIERKYGGKREKWVHNRKQSLQTTQNMEATERRSGKVQLKTCREQRTDKLLTLYWSKKHFPSRKKTLLFI